MNKNIENIENNKINNKEITYENKINMYVEREDLLATYPDKYSFQKGYEVNDEKLEAFLAYGEKEKVERNNDELKKSKRQITNLLKAYIARGLYNSGAYVQIINEVDPTVLKAVEVINDNTFNKLAVQYK